MTNESVNNRDARDYYYEKRNGLDAVIKFQGEEERSKAKIERDALDKHFRNRTNPREKRSQIHADFARDMREHRLKTRIERLVEEAGMKLSSKSDAYNMLQFWNECAEMNFEGLGWYMRERLSEVTIDNVDFRPRTHGSFIALWEMLLGKCGVSDLLGIPPLQDDCTADKYLCKESKRKRDSEVKERLKCLTERWIFLEELHKEILRTFDPRRVETDYVLWEILPPGHWNRFVTSHGLRRGEESVKYYDDAHMKYIVDLLNPVRKARGRNSFNGYIAFGFDYTETILLERPVYGNATYVIDSNWERLSRLTKQELLSKHSKNVTRVFHTDDWLLRVKAILGVA